MNRYNNSPQQDYFWKQAEHKQTEKKQRKRKNHTTPKANQGEKKYN